MQCGHIVPHPTTPWIDMEHKLVLKPEKQVIFLKLKTLNRQRKNETIKRNRFFLPRVILPPTVSW